MSRVRRREDLAERSGAAGARAGVRGAGEAGAELSEPGAGRSAETAGAGQTESGTDAPPDAAARMRTDEGGAEGVTEKSALE